VWDESGKLVSAGFPKFGNLGENTDVFGAPNSIEGCSVIEKIDGSCLIVSRWNNATIIRTRGTINARQMPNGNEINILVEKYSDFFNDLSQNKESDSSYLFEWVSPANQIVLKHSETKFFYIGKVRHDDYYLYNQKYLDNEAEHWGFERPRVFNHFDSIPYLIEQVKKFEDKEGVCIYLDNKIYKVKAEKYLKLHYFKSNLSYKSFVEMYLLHGKPTRQGMLDRIERDFDFECRQMAEESPEFIKFYEKEVRVREEIEKAKIFVEPLKLMDRKSAALKISKEPNPSFLFSVLDGQIRESMWKKLLHSENEGES
jgi:hypothetical protein